MLVIKDTISFMIAFSCCLQVEHEPFRRNFGSTYASGATGQVPASSQDQHSSSSLRMAGRVDDCLRQLTSLQTKLDELSKHFENTKKILTDDIHALRGQMNEMCMGTVCDLLLRALREAEGNEASIDNKVKLRKIRQFVQEPHSIPRMTAYLQLHQLHKERKCKECKPKEAKTPEAQQIPVDASQAASQELAAMEAILQQARQEPHTWRPWCAMTEVAARARCSVAGSGSPVGPGQAGNAAPDDEGPPVRRGRSGRCAHCREQRQMTAPCDACERPTCRQCVCLQHLRVNMLFARRCCRCGQQPRDYWLGSGDAGGDWSLIRVHERGPGRSEPYQPGGKPPPMPPPRPPLLLRPPPGAGQHWRQWLPRDGDEMEIQDAAEAADVAGASVHQSKARASSQGQVNAVEIAAVARQALSSSTSSVSRGQRGRTQSYSWAAENLHSRRYEDDCVFVRVLEAMLRPF